MAINVAPWIREQCVTTGTGALVLTSAVASFIRFDAAIGAGETVYYAVLDSNGNRESGVGVFDGTATVTRSRVTATLVGTAYNDTNPTALNLSGDSIVICAFTEAAYDDLVALIEASKPSKEVVIKSASQLAGALDSTVQYVIDGYIDMGSQSIQVPLGGLYFRGLGTDISGLTSSANNYTMFTGATAGNLFISSMDITTSGTSSRVYNLINGGSSALEVQQVNYVDCTSLGTVTAFRQGVETNTSRFGGTPELTLAGTWAGGFIITTSLVRNLVAGSYFLFKAGANLTFGSRFKNNFNVDLPAGVGIADFSPSNFPNPSTFQLVDILVTRAGVLDSDDALYLPNIVASDLSCAFRNNQGLDNTFEGLIAKISTEVLTTIAAANTFVDAAGTFTVTNLQHFSMGTNGQFRHDGISPEQYNLILFATLAGTANDVISIKLVKWDASASVFEDIDTQTRVINNSQSGDDLVYFTLGNHAKLNQNDYVKIQVTNTSGARDVTLRDGSELIIQTR